MASGRRSPAASQVALSSSDEAHIDHVSIAIETGFRGHDYPLGVAVGSRIIGSAVDDDLVKSPILAVSEKYEMADSAIVTHVQHGLSRNRRALDSNRIQDGRRYIDHTCRRVGKAQRTAAADGFYRQQSQHASRHEIRLVASSVIALEYDERLIVNSHGLELVYQAYQQSGYRPSFVEVILACIFQNLTGPATGGQRAERRVRRP